MNQEILEKKLRDNLPRELHGQVSVISRVIAALYNDKTHQVAPDLSGLMQELAGKEILAGSALVSFGKDTQSGDIGVRDIVNGNPIHITISTSTSERLSATTDLKEPAAPQRTGLAIKLALVSIGLIIAFAAGWLFSSSKGPVRSAVKSIIASVDATKDWQSAGIEVSQGQTVTIRVVGGKWTGWRERVPQETLGFLPEKARNELPQEIWMYKFNENSGEGIGERCIDLVWLPDPCPLPSSKMSRLIAKFGESDVLIDVGNARTFEAPSDGVVFLRMNEGQSQGDVALGDNAGVLAVEVSIEN